MNIGSRRLLMNFPLKIPMMDNLLLGFLIKNAWSAPFVCAQE